MGVPIRQDRQWRADGHHGRRLEQSATAERIEDSTERSRGDSSFHWQPISLLSSLLRVSGHLALTSSSARSPRFSKIEYNAAGYRPAAVGLWCRKIPTSTSRPHRSDVAASKIQNDLNFLMDNGGLRKRDPTWRLGRDGHASRAFVLHSDAGKRAPSLTS